LEKQIKEHFHEQRMLHPGLFDQEWMRHRPQYHEEQAIESAKVEVKHGWYSAEAVSQGVKTNTYSTPDGAQVRTTVVNNSPKDSHTSWKDIIYVGPVTKHVCESPSRQPPVWALDTKQRLGSQGYLLTDEERGDPRYLPSNDQHDDGDCPF
jgi:hypothetical protein